MKSNQLEEATLLELQKLEEMSSILTKESHLKTKLNILYNGAKQYPHWARVKIMFNDKEGFPILLNEKGIKPLNSDGQYNKLTQYQKNLVKEAILYIEDHKDIILAYWNGLFEEDILHDILQNKITLKDVLTNND